MIDALLPRGLDNKDVLLEVKAGVGGQEAGLFARDLMAMYQAYSQLQGWDIEVRWLLQCGL